MKNMDIGIIGKGNVGTAPSKDLSRAGHTIIFGHRDLKESVKKAAASGDVIILTVPQNAVQDAVKEFRSEADRKTFIDVTNALKNTMDLSIGCTTSAAEELQKLVPNSLVVKAFNTVLHKTRVLEESMVNS